MNVWLNSEDGSYEYIEAEFTTVTVFPSSHVRRRMSSNGRGIKSHPYLLLGSRYPKAGVKMRLSLALNCCTWTLTCTDWTVSGCTCKVRASGMTPDIIYGPRSLDQRSTQMYSLNLSLLTNDGP